MKFFAACTFIFAAVLSVNGNPLANRLFGSEPSSIKNEGACVVSLVYEKEFIGHGVLIKPDVVLTTASLLQGRSGAGFEIRAGSENFYQGGQVLYPATIIVNRDYDDVTKQNNIGMIFMCQPFTSADVQTCTLPPSIGEGSDPTLEIPSNGTIFGWGSPLKEVVDQAVSPILREITLSPNFDKLDDNCKRYNTNEQVCLNSDLNKNICYRDLGNGYVKDRVVYCIASDSGPCYTNLETPNNAICTSVSAHLEWIYKIYFTYANESSRVCIPK
ncbi:hypothetical protein ACFFRR_010022 [Megaselia abdita]